MSKSKLSYKGIKVIIPEHTLGDVDVPSLIHVSTGQILSQAFFYNSGDPADAQLPFAMEWFENDESTDALDPSVVDLPTHRFEPENPIVDGEYHIAVMRLHIPNDKPELCKFFGQVVLCQQVDETVETLKEIDAPITPLSPARRPTIPTWEKF